MGAILFWVYICCACVGVGMDVGADVCIHVHVLKAGHPCVLVIVFVLFGCVVLGLGFLSSLPLQLACHTCVFSCTYGLWVGI